VAPREGEDGPLRNIAGADYFRTLGMTLLRGRDFNPGDQENTQKVAVINESFARNYFAGADPIGKRIGPGGRPPEYVIVGIARDSKYAEVKESKTPSFWYIPYEQFDRVGQLTLHLRSAGDAAKMTAMIRREAAAIDPNVPLFSIRTLEEQVEEHLRLDKLVATLASIFGGLALLLAAVGLYGVMAYAVARRTREIGLRMALGAGQSRVLWMVLRETLNLVAIGVIAGVPAAFALARYIKTLLFGVQPTDLFNLVAAILLLTTVAITAGFLPARRAARVDPMIALRWE
jgi:predicted permease